MFSFLRPLFLLIIAVFASHVVSAETRGMAALDSLDIYISQHSKYSESVTKSLDDLKKTLTGRSVSEKLGIYARLVREYRHIDLDSAMFYAQKGLKLATQLGDRADVVRFNLLLCTVGPIYGIVKESVDGFEQIDPGALPDSLKSEYFITADLLYNYAKDFYPTQNLKKQYTELGHRAVDSLVKYLDPATPEYDFYVADSKLNKGDGARAIDDMVALLAKIPFDDHLYARTAAIIGSALVNDPYSTDDAIYYLARSAMSDIVTGNRETTSLHRLGKLLYEKGDIDRAYNYLTRSLATAVDSRSRLRTLEIAEAIPIVFQTVQERDARAHRTLVVVIFILSILLVVLIVLFFIYDRNRRRLARMKLKLTEALDLKDNYIRRILSLCSAYLTALENFNRVAGRKIKAGQVADLLNMIESGKIIREQLHTFYEFFDSAFLIVYPDFVREVNSLLLPDKQINLPEGERLTPELRILAFMKLGVDDSTQISKFLGLSLNTVYTYRNKIKMKAVDRENFEDNIIHIGKIS